MNNLLAEEFSGSELDLNRLLETVFKLVLTDFWQWKQDVNTC